MDAQQRDERFASWMDQHSAVVFKVARSFTTNAADLDDLVQEILLQLWRSAATFRGESKPSTWIYRIALNKALTWQQRDKADRRRQEPLVDLSQLVSGARIDDNQRVTEIYSQMRALKEIDRSLILLSLDGFSYREMADVLGITESNVGARLTRARHQLSALLTKGNQ